MPTRARDQGSKQAVHTSHQDHIAAKGMNSMIHYSVVHKFIPMPQALKIPDAKAAVEKEWVKLEKIRAWQLTNVRDKKEVIEKASNKGKQVHFASLMDLCRLKNSELEPQYQKCKGWVVLRGDIVKDDPGSYAVIYWTRIINVTDESRKSHGHKTRDYRDAQDKQQTQYPLTPRTKMEDAQKLIPKSECPDIWIRLPKHKWPKSWSSIEDPVIPFGRNLYGHPSVGLLWERQFGKVLLKYGWEKVPNWDCFFGNREKGLFLSVNVDDIKLGGKKQNINPTWKKFMKDVDLREPTSFVDHVYLGLHSKTMPDKQGSCRQLQK